MSHHHHHHQNFASANNLKIVFFLNAFFTIVEFWGGWYTNSVAIFSDALHDLGDTAALGLAWYLQNLSQKESDHEYSYGYGRFSLLGSIITSIILIVGSVFIIQESIPRLFDPVQPHTQGMIWLGVLGILVNGAAVFRLKDSTSLNEKAAMFHLLEDVFGWIIVLVGAVVMKYYNMPYIDPLLSLILAAIILRGVYKNLSQSFRIMMQAIPKGIDLKRVIKLIEAHSKVKKVTDIHIWSTDGEYNVMTANLDIEEISTNDFNTLQEEMKTLLKEQDIHHATLEFKIINKS